MVLLDDTMLSETASLSVGYRSPFEWDALFAYLAARATPGVEAVDQSGRYWRTVQLHEHRGYIALSLAGGALRLELSSQLLPASAPLIARIRRLLDLDADPQAIADSLARDPALAPLIARRPGLRVPGAVDGFELALRAVLGQQVSVRGASTLAGRLAGLVGERLPDAPTPTGMWPAPLARLPVTAARLADASPEAIAVIGLPRARARCVLALARAAATGELPELTHERPVGDPESVLRRLTSLPGIGEWTAAYIAMRALRWPDAFPEGDLGLRKAMGGLSPARLRAVAERWRPWRAYAAQHLWASLGDREPSPFIPFSKFRP